jgi:hypothetical protein
MPTIALVDDDHNILTSVAIALDLKATALPLTLTASRHSTASRLPSPTLSSSILKCPAWTVWRPCAGCAKTPTCQ